MADLHLGGRIDPATGTRSSDASVLPSGDLTTHGVIIGMTGSGKTGLGVVLIEEVLNSGVPALLIDPKGDLTNLMLIFPELRGSDFRPWINDGDAEKAGLGLDEFAEQQATSWRDGLAGWEITPERLAALKSKVDFTIYTPGSSAGRPLNIVGSLDAPPADTDPEVMSDEIDGYVTSVLGMIGINGDPLSSREHILLANLIQNAWSQGQNLDLSTLLAQVQQPPIRKLGVLELDVFFPPNDRLAFAMKLNGLLASPSFAAWLTGDPIDIQSMLFTADGKARCAIVTTAHLSDDQRQSVTSLVLSKLVTWMRRQSGTSDLRALLYMDEVAGYLPPTANPPTKKPMMLLLKQARAFGLGVVLSTQNPVDLDYKALSNTGTWMVGRLQTEQDKKRLVDGLTSAAGGVDVSAVSDTISNLGKRQFLLRRAGKDVPEVMTSRWAMSYLRGPLTRDQIKVAMEDGPAAAAVPAETAAPASAAAVGSPDASDVTAVVIPSAGVVTEVVGASADVVTEPTMAPPAVVPTSDATQMPAPADIAPSTLPSVAPAQASADETPVMPAIAAGIPVAFVDPATTWLAEVGGVNAGQHLRAAAVARVNLRYDDTPSKLILDEEYEAVLLPLTQIPDGRKFVAVDYDDRDLITTAPVGSVYGFLPSEVKTKAYWNSIQKALVDELVRSKSTQIWANMDLKAYSRVGETQEDFTARCLQLAASAADGDMAKLRTKYETKVTAAKKKITDASITVDQHQRAYDASYGLGAMVTSAIGGLFGGRKSGASLAADARRQREAQAKIDTASAKYTAAEQAYQDLENQLNSEILSIHESWQGKALNITTKDIPLSKSDVTVTDFRCVWIPVS